MPTNSKVAIWNLALSKIGVTKRVESDDDDSIEANSCDLIYDDLLKELLEQRQWQWATRQATLLDVSTVETLADGDAANDTFDVGNKFAETSQVAVYVSDVEQTAGTDYNAFPPDSTYPNGYVEFAAGSIPASGTNNVKIVVTISRSGWDYVYRLPPDFVHDVGLLYEDVPFDHVAARSRMDYDTMPDDSGDGWLLATNWIIGTDFASFQYIALIDKVAFFPRLFVDALAWRMAMELAMPLTKNIKRHALAAQQFAIALDKASAHDQNRGQLSYEADSPTYLQRGV